MKTLEKLNQLDNKALQEVKGGVIENDSPLVLYGSDINGKKECKCTGTGDNKNDAAKCTCSDTGCKKDFERSIRFLE
ncbi:MAG: hypothetical protein RR061_09880 [Muribaculaceae bacterium]